MKSLIPFQAELRTLSVFCETNLNPSGCKADSFSITPLLMQNIIIL